MRRTEFIETDLETAKEVLTNSKIGHLAYIRDGQPEVLPYNFTQTSRGIEFHSSPKSGIAGAVGQRVNFLAYDSVVWVPSTWRHPELACPATTYYRSVTVKGRLESLEATQDKADSLAAFMAKYQPDDSYRPLDDPVYQGPLEALFVARLSLDEVYCKVKMGQHLSSAQRRKVYSNLQARSQLGDRQVCQAMCEANPDLHEPGWREHLNPQQQKNLWKLLRHAYWIGDRNQALQRQYQENSEVIVSRCEGERVQSFARVLRYSDNRGYLADMIVAPEVRGRGLGTQTLYRLLEHPRIRSMETLSLRTRDAQNFYSKFGFRVEREEPEQTLMVRASEDS